jgi:CHAT domain-containing protein
MEIKKEVFGVQHERYGMVLSNLAGCYKDQGKYSKAEPLYLQALEIQKALFSEKNTTYATYIDNLGVLYTLMRQYDKALVYYTEALDFYKTKLGENHPEVGLTLNNLGTLYLEKGDYASAEKYFSASLEIRKTQEGEAHPDYALTLNDMAYCYFLMGDYAKAEPWYKLANEKTVFQIAHNYPTLSENEKAMFYSVIDNNFSGFNRFAYQRVAANPAIAGDAMNNQLATGSMLLENSRNVRLQVLSSGDTALVAKYSKWMMLRTEIGKAYMMTEAERVERKISVTTLEQESNELEKAVLGYLQAAGIGMAGALKWQEVQTALAPEEAVIEFLSFSFTNQSTHQDSTMYVALVLKAGDIAPVWVPLFEEQQLYAMLSDTSVVYASSDNRGLKVNNARMGPKFGPLNPEIYSLVWKPLESALGQVKTVFLCPAGLLNKISFAALRPDSNVFLCDRYDIRYLLTSRDLAKAKQKKQVAVSGMQAVLAGGADFNVGVTAENQLRSGNWTYLPGTLAEVEFIRDLLSKASVNIKMLEGKDATEEQIKKLSGVNAPAVLHISTHGFFFSRTVSGVTGEETDPLVLFRSAENPLLRSGLVLSGVNQVWSGNRPAEGAEDGVLTAYEVSNLDLNKTQLVVLSACETGLGDIKAGEGVFGLQRAFRLAGAGSIMLSMWAVPDKETVELMQAFYSGWMAGVDMHSAFTSAQDAMRKKYPMEPAKWAGFILIE